jgi:hypothetical protein
MSPMPAGPLRIGRLLEPIFLAPAWRLAEADTTALVTGESVLVNG